MNKNVLRRIASLQLQGKNHDKDFLAIAANDAKTLEKWSFPLTDTERTDRNNISFDVVVDPMAGGGTTIDVCRYLLRRYYCFDIDSRRPDIKQWDIRKGYPRLPQKPDFIILDPPYWRLKQDEYSQDGVAMTSYQEEETQAIVLDERKYVDFLSSLGGTR